MFKSLRQVVFLSVALVQRAGRTILLILETSLFVSGAVQVQVAGLILVVGLLEVEVAELGHFGEFGCPLLQLEEVVVGGLDSLVAVRVLALFLGTHVTEAVDLALVAGTLLLELLELE